MQLITKTSEEYSGKTISRKKYEILEVRFSDLQKSLQEQLIKEANNLASQVNPHSANEGINRSPIQRRNDAYAGLLAEYATLLLLNSLYPGSAIRPTVTNSKNQIDIQWIAPDSKEYTIEVRSSFVKNGLLFGLFGYNKFKETTYFDVLGPYRQNNYKRDYESTKDLFFRVLFEGTKSFVYERFIEKDEAFYIIGAMSGAKIVELNQHKSLQPGSAVQKRSDFSGDYYVAPISLIGDIQQFKEAFRSKKVLEK